MVRIRGGKRGSNERATQVDMILERWETEWKGRGKRENDGNGKAKKDFVESVSNK